MSVNLTERPQVARPVAETVRPVPVPALSRARRLAVEAVKFGVVGGSGVAVNILAFNALLHGLSWAPMTATALASVIAMGTNYLGFRFFAYRDRASRSRQQIALFFVFSGIGVVLESVLFYAGYHGFGMTGPIGSNVAKALSIVLASAFRFLVYRTWVFQHEPKQGPGAR